MVKDVYDQDIYDALLTFSGNEYLKIVLNSDSPIWCAYERVLTGIVFKNELDTIVWCPGL